MKSLLPALARALALLVTLGLAAGCGPQEAFCPNTSAKDAGGVCPINGDDVMVRPTDMGGNCGGQTCGQGEYCGDDPSGNGGSTCLCSIGGGLPPCN